MSTSFDPKQLRSAFGQFMTGVTIVTVMGEDETPIGITANSFTSVSLEPPMVLVCVDKKINSYPAFRNATHYAVHILSHDQAELSTKFASRGVDKFGGLNWSQGVGGVPVLPEYMALFECSLAHAYDAGDHTILVGQVERFAVPGADRQPLGFFRGKYTTAAQ